MTNELTVGGWQLAVDEAPSEKAASPLNRQRTREAKAATASLRALLEGLIDYAGLFPPAALSMQDAVRNYARYREEEYAWALGRFVVPADRAHEVPADFPRSELAVGGWQLAVDEAPSENAVGPLDRQPPTANRQRTHEARAATIDDVERIASSANGRMVYVEITDLALLDSLARHGLRAKIRTGGITPEAFPPIGDVAKFLRACKAAGVAFKATAGLHHPLRCVKPLTYAVDAPTGTMHGFLNVFLAAALLDHADEILREEEPRAFTFDDDGASWRGHRVTTGALRAMRRDFATSFGSCSFEEPIADLRAMEWLA